MIMITKRFSIAEIVYRCGRESKVGKGLLQFCNVFFAAEEQIVTGR